MRKLFLYVFTIVASLFLLDRGGACLMSVAQRRSQDMWSYKLRRITSGISEDVVLMGTSRCHNHYVSPLIADSLGMTVYNAGITSTKNIYTHYMVLHHLLRHHIPRMVCLEVMTNDFLRESDAFAPTLFLAPYFGECDAADSVFRDAGTYWALRLSHLYRYNGRAFENVAGLILDWQQTDTLGYLPIPAPSAHPPVLGEETLDAAVDPRKVRYLRRFASLCRQHGILLVWTISPRFSLISPEFYAPLHRLAQEMDIPLLDYHTPGFLLDRPDLFFDIPHLWDRGARLFSARFAHDLDSLNRQWDGE